MSNNKKTQLISGKGLAALSSFRSVSQNLVRKPNNSRAHFNKALGNRVRFTDHKEDGVDHINVSRQSKTELGKIFSLADPSPYFDEVLNMEIPSLDIFFNFAVSTKKDITIIKNKKSFVKRQEGETGGFNYHDICILMGWAVYQKIQSYRDIRDILSSIDKGVSFDSYTFIKGHGERVRKAYSSAMAVMVNVMHESIKRKIAPDMRDFLPANDAYRLTDSPEDREQSLALFKEQVEMILFDTVAELGNKPSDKEEFSAKIEQARLEREESERQLKEHRERVKKKNQELQKEQTQTEDTKEQVTEELTQEEQPLVAYSASINKPSEPVSDLTLKAAPASIELPVDAFSAQESSN